MILKSLLNLVIGADFLFEIWVDGVQGDALPDKNDQGGEEDTQCDPADVSVFFHFDAPHRDGLLSGGAFPGWFSNIKWKITAGRKGGVGVAAYKMTG